MALLNVEGEIKQISAAFLKCKVFATVRA